LAEQNASISTTFERSVDDLATLQWVLSDHLQEAHPRSEADLAGLLAIAVLLGSGMEEAIDRRDVLVWARGAEDRAASVGVDVDAARGRVLPGRTSDGHALLDRAHEMPLPSVDR
jgi:hypothetical protein